MREENMRLSKGVAGVCAALAVLFAIGAAGPQAGAQQGPSPATKAVNAAETANLDWADAEDFNRAQRGFIATRTDPKIRAADGRVVWDLDAYSFVLTGVAPDTVNRSLWRQSQLLARHGLFQVAPLIYQVRGFDISNITFIQGDSGWIIIDPLTNIETARAALDLANEKLGARPVKAVIYTHSHADHFGGVKGVVDPADVAAGRVKIIAPAGFLEHAVAENLLAGPAMSRRAAYQFGTPLPRAPNGQMGAGIGLGIPMGTLSLIAPTTLVEKTGESLTLDGVRFEFQLTPGAEAPAELNFFLPDLGALCLAENANATMHNVLPPRGALVRDAKQWADFLTEALVRYGDRSEVLFLVHTWPRWGKSDVAAFIATHRDAYKYLHDQAVRLMNQGLTAPEIADQITLPPELSRLWHNRGYYGTMRHNARAVYQRYLGWYDGNPARLNALAPQEAGKRYVAALGGAEAVLAQVERAMQAGDYRWASELASHLVFAEPDNAKAKLALAKAFEQLGYQAESMLWRNMYLTGALELREGVKPRGPGTVSIDLISATPTPMIFDLLAVRVDPEKALGVDLAVRFVFPERSESVLVTVRNRVLVHRSDASASAQAIVTVSRANFLRLFFQGADGRAMVFAGDMRISGDAGVLQRFGAVLDRAGPSDFAIVTP
jgi:alkyl sulfatase BDS1-like metallo-beta-lactamase superfamily hydrolase